MGTRCDVVILGFLLSARGWACADVDLGAALKAARGKLGGDPAGAIAILDAAWESLPGSCSPVDPAKLGDFALVAMLIARGDAAASARWALVAGSLAQAPTCTPDLGDCGEYRVILASDVVAAERELWVDGVRLGVGEQRTLAPGRHLLQVAGEAGSWFTTEGGLVLGLPSLEPYVQEVAEDRRWVRPLVVTGTGAVLTTLGGFAVFGAGYGSTWYAECAPGDYERGVAPLPPTWEGLATCQERTGDPVLRNWVLSVGLTAVGVGAGVTGVSWLTAEVVSARLTVGPGGVGVSGRF